MPPKSWRSLGYVPDSDDEEDIIALERNQDSLSESGKDSDTSTTSNTEHDMTGVFPSLVDVIIPHHETEVQGAADHESLSELSDVPNDPEAPLFESHGIENDLTYLGDRQSHATESLEHDVFINHQLPLQRYSERSLRERRPVQLRPYSTEAIKYKQTCRARGVIPVNVREAPNKEAEDERDQEDEYSTEDETQLLHGPSILQSSSPKRSHSKSLVTPFGHDQLESASSSQSMPDDDDELPDLLTILRNGRNKSDHGLLQTLKRKRQTVDVDVLQAPEQKPSDAEIFDFPQSSTEKQRPTKKRKSFHIPAIPKGLLSLAQVEADQIPSVITISDDSSSNSEESEVESLLGREMSSSQEVVERMARQIKGVLPRSFATLDIQRQKAVSSTQAPKRGHRVRDLHSPLRGVARPARKMRAKAVINQIDLELVEPESDDGILEMPKEIQTRTPIVRNRRLSPSSDPGRMMKDDPIDFLEPSNKRPRNPNGAGSRSKASHQSRLDGTLAFGATSFRDRRTVAPRSDNTAAWRPKSKRTIRTSPPVRLGVLDVDDLTPPSKVPDFLKTARRQARKDKHFARGSPTNRHFRLQTLDDTVVVNELLKRWKRGSIAQKPLHRRDISRSLRETSDNPRSWTRCVIKSTTAKPDVPTRRAVPKVHSTGQGQRKLQSYVTTSKHPFLRTAQLETLEKDAETRNHRAYFQSHLIKSHREFQRPNPPFRDVNLAPADVAQYRDRPEGQGKSITIKDTTGRKSRISNKQKHVAQRRHVHSIQFQQPEQDIVDSRNLRHLTSCLGSDIAPVQEGSVASLIGFQPNYSDDFDIHPFRPGTFFQSDNFIGSGEFSSIITFDGRDLNVNMGNQNVSIGTIEYTWGPWDFTIENQIRQLMQKIYNDLEAALHTDVKSDRATISLSLVARDLKLLGLTNATWLSFAEENHVNQFASALSETLAPLMMLALTRLIAMIEKPESHAMLTSILRVILTQLSLCAQVTIQVRHGSAPGLRGMIITVARGLLDAYFAMGVTETRKFLDNNHDCSVQNQGIQEHLWIELILILHHVCIRTEINFWQTVSASREPFILKAFHISELENAWCGILTIMPVLEMDDHGISVMHQRFEQEDQDWRLPKLICEKVFQFYLENNHAPVQQVIANQYIRTLLRRVYLFIETWGWKRPDLIITPIYDFYAMRKFIPLHKEETFSSPSFILNPGQINDLQLLPMDKSFHIFLKLLASSLRSLTKAGASKHSKSLVWRCLPNHNRIHKKEDDLRQTDLDALRNQHDLLVTLCLFCPSESRFRLVEKVRELVDHKLSHQESCRLNIRSFKALALHELQDSCNFQIYASWMDVMVEETWSQFRAARAQIELQYNDYCPVDRENVSLRCVQSTIKSNQSQVLQTFDELVSTMRAIISRASSQNQVVDFLRNSRFERTLSLLDESSNRASSLVVDILGMYMLFLQLPCASKSESQTSCVDESQDYGDWPEEQSDVEFIQVMLFRQLSIVFGSEKRHSTDIITTMVRSWAILASMKVDRAQACWSDFLDAYGEYSWKRLPVTDLRRVYSPVFHASILNLNTRAFLAERQYFLSAWLMALVEPEESFRFQDDFTAAILNAAAEHELLSNLPFYRDSNGKFQIHQGISKARRLGVLSSILSNMSSLSSTQPLLRTEYATYLNDIMTAMKGNFLAMHRNDLNRATYVEFIHRMMEHLQQFASNLCTIDTFFLNAGTFPLPEDDPGYVTSKLKGYGENDHGGVMTRLISFFQSVSERSIADNFSRRFACQLQEAMNAGIEGASTGSCTLRSILLEGIFPSYFQSMFTTPCGWLLAQPMLHATAAVFRTLHYKFELTSTKALSSIASMISVVLAELCQAVESLIEHPQMLRQPSSLTCLRLITMIMAAAVTPLVIVRRIRGFGTSAVTALMFFKSFTCFCLQFMAGRERVSDVKLHVGGVAYRSTRHAETRRICSQAVMPNSRTNWVKEGSHYYFQSKGGPRKQVFPLLGTEEEEKEALRDAIVEFHNALLSISAVRDC